MKTGSALALAALFALCPAQGKPPKAPKVSFDRVMNMTQYSTGMVSIGKDYRYEFYYYSKQKTNRHPSTIGFRVVATRSVDSKKAEVEREFERWKGLSSILYNLGDGAVTLSAAYSRHTNRDRESRAILGEVFNSRVFWEEMSMIVTDELIEKMAKAPEFVIRIGQEDIVFKGKSAEPLKRFVASIPPKGL